MIHFANVWLMRGYTAYELQIGSLVLRLKRWRFMWDTNGRKTPDWFTVRIERDDYERAKKLVQKCGRAYRGTKRII